MDMDNVRHLNMVRNLDGNSEDRTFSTIIPGRISMPGYMHFPVVITFTVGLRFPDLLQVKVSHKGVFQHHFSASLRQLKDGRTAAMHSSHASIQPADGRRVSIQAHTWHWQIPVEISRDDIDQFVDDLETFFAG